jgi:hypothetical protein
MIRKKMRTQRRLKPQLNQLLKFKNQPLNNQKESLSLLNFLKKQHHASNVPIHINIKAILAPDVKLDSRHQIHLENYKKVLKNLKYLGKELVLKK